MPAAFSFGLAFGSLVFARALLDGTPHSVAVSVIMFLFFASVAGIAYLGVATVVGRRPLWTAVLTALLLLLLVSAPGLLTGSLTPRVTTRLLTRLAGAWVYVTLLFAVLGRMAGVKVFAFLLAVLLSGSAHRTGGSL